MKKAGTKERRKERKDRTVKDREGETFSDRGRRMNERKNRKGR